MLEYNKRFVAGKGYEKYKTNSIPNKRMVVFSCMESRLVELLPRALNIQNGDVKMLKNAGAIIRKPFDSIMKGILIAVYELQAEVITVIGHHDCGMSHVEHPKLINKMFEQGIPKHTIDMLTHAGIDLYEEFQGFNTVEESIRQSVDIIRHHPLLPKHIKVYGLVIDPDTGKVDIVIKDE